MILKPNFEMKDLFLRFPHLMEQILQKLDNKSLVKSREAARIWQEFIDHKTYPWLRIVKIPTILKRGNAYLHIAVIHNQIDMFENILINEVDKNLVNDNGFTPFLVACLFGRVRIAKILMKQSVELKIFLTKTTNCKSTAFHLACIGGNSELTEIIMKNSDKIQISLNEIKPTDFRNCGIYGRDLTGFLYAVWYGNLKIVEMIMNNSKSMNIELNTFHRSNCSALHFACYKSHAKIAEILIAEATKLKLDLNAQDEWGYTAFHMACRSGLASIVNIMLDQSDPPKFDLSLQTKNAQTGFHFACKAGQTKIVEMLIDASEDIMLDLTAIDRWGKTGFQLADNNVVDLIKSKMPSLVI